VQPTIHPFLTQISEYVLRSDQQDRSGPYSYTIHIETRLVQCRSNLSTGRVALRRDPYAANFGPIIIPRPEMPQRFSRIPVRRPKTPMPQTLVRNPAARNGPKILPHTPQNPYAANFGPKSRGPKCPKDSPACGAPKLLCRKHSPACGGSRNPYAANFGPKSRGPKCPKDSPACGAPKPYAANILPPAAGPGTLMPQTLAQNPLMPGSFGGYPPPPGEVLVTVKADLCAQKFAA